MTLYYAVTGVGCCIQEHSNIEAARKSILKEVGTMNGITTLRKATPQDISWVTAMGGYIPKVKKEPIKEPICEKCGRVYCDHEHKY